MAKEATPKKTSAKAAAKKTTASVEKNVQKATQKTNKDLKKAEDKLEKSMKKAQQMGRDTLDTVEAVASGYLSEQKIVNALSYIPYGIGPVLMYFFSDADQKKTMHHIKYAVILGIGAFLLSFVLNSFFTGVLQLAYIIASGYFAFRALQWDDMHVKILDEIEDQVAKTTKNIKK